MIHIIRRRALTLAILCLGLLGVTSGSALPSLTVTRINLSSMAMARYASSHSLRDLQAAVDALSGTFVFSDLTPNNFIPTRRAIVQAFGPVLKAIEQSYEPNYNPNDRSNTPFFCPPPPAGLVPSGVSDGCIDPNTIRDPNVRAQYVAAMHTNNLKKQRAGHYADVSNIDAQAMATLSASLELLNSVAPEGAGPDFSALDGILQRAGISSARRAQVDAMFYATPQQ